MMMMDVGMLKRIIARYCIPDDAKIYVDGGLNPLAIATPECLVLGPGIAIGPCQGVSDQEETLQRARSEHPGDADGYRAESVLMLYSEEGCEDMDLDEDEDEEDLDDLTPDDTREG